MNRPSYLPLTETTYYILLALLEPAHGYAIMQTVEDMSQGQVRIAAGTMYGAIDNLLKLGWIVNAPSTDARRKVYALSSLGKEVLKEETARLRQLLALAQTKNL